MKLLATYLTSDVKANAGSAAQSNSCMNATRARLRLTLGFMQLAPARLGRWLSVSGVLSINIVQGSYTFSTQTLKVFPGQSSKFQGLFLESVPGAFVARCTCARE